MRGKTLKLQNVSGDCLALMEKGKGHLGGMKFTSTTSAGIASGHMDQFSKKKA